jgi:ABC-type transport system involved in multi-copper enzyme maturation permease subunit
MSTIWTIARLTFREALRRKIVLAALILGIAFLFLYGLGFHFIQQDFTNAEAPRFSEVTVRTQAYNFILMAGMYVVNFLGIAIAALITSDSLSGEIQSGTIQAVATKPIQRSGIVLGKWLGNAILLCMYLALMGGGVLLILLALANYQPPNGLVGLALIYLNSITIMSLTLAFSSSLSTLATGGAVFGAFGLAFLGGWVERIGSLLGNQTAVNLGIFSSLLLPTETVWNKAGTLMASPFLRATDLGPFSSSSQPSTLMLIYAGLYLLGALGIAIHRFNQRDL